MITLNTYTALIDFLVATQLRCDGTVVYLVPNLLHICYRMYTDDSVNIWRRYG